MATTVARLEAILSANTRDFDRAMATSETKMQKTGRVAGIAGLAIAGGLAYGLEKSVHAALDAQVSQARLEQAFNTSRISARVYAKQVEELERSGRKLGFTDEQTKDSLGSLLIATHSMTKASHDLSVAQNIARFRHVDLNTATKMLTMAMAGSQRATKQLGIDVPKVTTRYDRLKATFGATISPAEKLALAQAKINDKHATAARVIETVQQKLGGQAAAYSKTAAGGMEQFHAQLNHLEVSMGTALLPALTKVAEKLAEFMDFLSKHTTTAKLLALAITGIALALGALSIASTIAAISMSAFWIAATAGLVLIIPALIALVYEVVKHWDAIKKATFGAWNAVKDAISGAVSAVLDFVRAHWPLLVGLLTGPIGLAVAEIIKHRDRLIEIFTNLPGKIADAFTAGTKLVKDAVVGLFGKVIDWVKHALGISSPSAVFHRIGQQSIQGYINGVGSMAGVLKNAVINMAKDAVKGLGGLLDIGGGGINYQQGTQNANKRLGQQMAARMGWVGAEFQALDSLWTRESGWNNRAKNPSSGAYGIPQALPATKMPQSAWPESLGGHSNAAAQIAWGLNYIRGRYGDPLAALRHENQFNWYDKGGWLPTGPSLAINNTGRPERVLGPGESGNVINFNFPSYVGSRRELMTYIQQAAAEFQRRNGRMAF